MRFYECKQSNTSPLRYRLELTLEELELVKDLVMDIINRVKQDEDKEID